MKLSIVMPSFNSEKHLNECLAAIQEQSYKDFEVILVDCSVTQEPKDIAEQYSFVEFIREENRFNPGQGRNIGVSRATGDYIVFIDSDVVLAPDALTNIANVALTGKQVFGGALELHKEHRVGLASDFEHYYFNHENQSTREANPDRANLSSAFLIIEKRLFEQVGGFADIPRMQDTELTERLRHEQKVSLGFEPSVIGFQIQDSPMSKVLRKIFITGNNLYFLRYQSSSKLGSILFLLLVPFMAIAKATRINLRNLKYWFSFRQLLIMVPCMYFLTFVWMCGLCKGVFGQEGISKQR